MTPLLLPILDVTSSDRNQRNKDPMPSTSQWAGPGKVPFKFHQLWSSHKLIRIPELERWWYIIPNYCLCRINQSACSPRAPASWDPTTGFGQGAITFSTSWMCSCLSASVILSTYRLSTLMRSLKHKERHADCRMANSQSSDNKLDTHEDQEDTSLSVRSCLFLPGFSGIKLLRMQVNIAPCFGT